MEVKKFKFMKFFLFGLIVILSSVYFLSIRSSSRNEIKVSKLPREHKVVRVYNKNAVSWDYKTEPYLDFVNQEVINSMLEEGLKELTGKNSIKEAWLDVFSLYEPGDKVAIKPNFNALGHGKYKDIMTSPQVINAVIKGLVEFVGVPENDIFVYDLCQIITDDEVRNRINYSVNFVQRFKPVSALEKIIYRIKRRFFLGLESPDASAPIHMREKVVYKGNPVICYIPNVLTQAQHLINIPLMTNHIFVLASGPLKNHFGTVRFSNYQPFPSALHGKILEKSIVDLNLNPHIRDKTRLIVCDALFGVYCRGEGNVKKKWKTFPSENGMPNSLFLSRDPVALESVTSDYILKEREYNGYKIFSHEYLHDAMENGLGTHEHRDEEGKYKRINYKELKSKN